MGDYRFRAGEKGELVLQVGEYPRTEISNGYQFHRATDSRLVWRDATVSDIPVRDPFDRERDRCGSSMTADYGETP